MSMDEQADVVVVGLGPGGEYVAGTLAEAGLDVVGVEAELVGGECPYWACVPSKMMIRAGNLLAEAGRVPGLAGEAEVTADWAKVSGRIRDEATHDWNDQVAVARLVAKGGRLVRGAGRLAGPGRVTVGGRTVQAGQDRLLSREEPEAGELAAETLRADGVRVLTGVRARQVGHDGAMFTVLLDDGAEALQAQRLLVVTGRHADLSALAVETVGLDPAAPAVSTDGQMRAADALWAVGDITGRGAFTHVSMYQAEIAVRDILGRPGPDADYRALPRVTFTDPEIAAVGLTEQQARDRGLRVATSVLPLASSTRGWIHGPGGEGFIKLVEDADRGVLVGATSVGPAGGEVLYGLNVAVHAEVPVDRLRHMIYTYPTFHRAVGTALGALR
ncbi:FAD-dependent oxidoreductase [Streptomyces rubrogriseus]|uniref:FAD-dependent oxidoreductase n=1 Tax=Streptomyces rubrogriseus TaxID=194673 RepID=UPI00382EC312